MQLVDYDLVDLVTSTGLEIFIIFLVRALPFEGFGEISGHLIKRVFSFRF